MLKDLYPYEERLKTNDKCPGAYVITHVSTGIMYIGSSLRPAERVSFHLSRLRKGLHDNTKFQEHYRSDSKLEWKYYLVKDRDTAYDLEQALIEYYQIKGELFNIAMDVRAPRRGVAMCPEHKEKFRNARLGKKNSPEHRKKISEALTGTKQTEERKQRSSEIRKGIPLTSEKYNKLWKYTRLLQKPLMGDGVRYDGTRDAGRKLKIDPKTVAYRIKCKRSKYDGWYYITDPLSK